MFLVSLLSSGKHNDEVNFVTLFDRLKEFIGVCTGMIDINFNGVEQFIFFGKQRFLHPAELLSEMVENIHQRISLPH